MSNALIIDGAAGEGGGQILRTALALSLVTGRPFRIENIRAGRRKPGLLRQHLTAVQAAVQVSGARVTGDTLGSQALSLEPARVRGGDYHLAVGTAGSAPLVLQTILLALVTARESSRVTLEGGTHNPGAPPFDFLARTFLPLLTRMGARVQARLDAHGFYPAGGGRFQVDVEPSSSLAPLTLLQRGPVRLQARALVAAVSRTIGKRELSIVRTQLGIERSAAYVECIASSVGPGNALMIDVESDEVVEVVTGFGIKGVSAESVAAGACDEAARYVNAGVPVGVHLADQLLIPMALAGGGSFRTLKPTPHTLTNADVIRKFLDVAIDVAHERADAYCVTIRRNVDRVSLGPGVNAMTQAGSPWTRQENRNEDT